MAEFSLMNRHRYEETQKPMRAHAARIDQEDMFARRARNDVKPRPCARVDLASAVDGEMPTVNESMPECVTKWDWAHLPSQRVTVKTGEQAYEGLHWVESSERGIW